MIKTLKLKNYILISELEINFTDGLNVITGETGSGKSILINAIDAVFGAKSSKEQIKNGKEKALIELTLSTNNDFKEFFDEYGIDDFGDEIVLTKEITQASSRSRINGTLVNQECVKKLKEQLLDIHSQHQTYAFMQPSYHLTLLDSFAKDGYCEMLKEYKQKWQEYQTVLSKLKDAKNHNEMTEAQIDFINFQVNEIAEANIEDINEDEELQNELNILSNAEKLKEYTMGAFWALSEDDNSCINSLLQVKSNLSKISDYDENVAKLEESIIDKLEELKDIASELNSYSSRLEFDKERIDVIQERLFLLDKLKRKYGNTLENVLNTYEKLSSELLLIQQATTNIEQLESDSLKHREELLSIASKITKARTELSETLSNSIVSELSELELPKSRFKIALNPCELSANGAENAEFLISTNISQDLKPLAKVASGGEISRIMLAIKSIFASNDTIDTVIFDEIDTGISGKASISVAEKMEHLAKFRQIILITHQAIIASKAQNHIYVSKEQSESSTNVSIKILNDTEKLNALAELASGKVDESSIDFARSLVE